MDLRTLHGLWGDRMTASAMRGKLVSADYAPKIRAERIIASSRVVLALFSLLAVWLDPYAPANHADITYLILVGYSSYALIVAAVAWLAHGPLLRLSLATHVLDLLLFSVLTYMTEGPTSPFFMYFMFAIVAATLRWQWRGALWTAAAALVMFIGTGIFAAEVMNDPAFEENRFVIRSVYLAVMAALLGYLGAYEERRRREMSQLAAWPPHRVRGFDLPQPEMLESAARILETHRLLLAWEETDEPWLHLAQWHDGDLRTWREAPETYQPVVAEHLSGLTFLSKDVAAPVPVVVHHATPTPRGWRGAPIHPALLTRFGMGAALCMPLRGECLEGHLFALDKARMTEDDLLLGEIVGHAVASSMDQSLLSRRLRRAAAAEERMRLTRDLHDGVLQSLTGAALQLEAVHRIWDSDSQVARERLAAVQRLIVEEQRDLRFFIRVSKLAHSGIVSGSGSLHTVLRQLVARLEDLWGLHVELRVEHLDDRSSEALAYDVCFIVQEALVNAARHAAASEVQVDIARSNGHLHVAVTDNGRGFPFEGDYDDAKLDALHLGPVMLKERVKSLGGSLIIHSTPAGARLDIHLPRDHQDGE